jgi:hypothetical protein
MTSILDLLLCGDMMNLPRIATMISDQDFHYIDHLAPLSSLLEVPMVLSDERLMELVNTYYPEVKINLLFPLELPQYLVSEFEMILTCLPTPLFKSIVYAAELINHKTLINVWCPHGNSDKGHKGPYMEELNQEKVALVYGEKMISFLSDKGSYNQLEKVCITGNYRYRYYRERKKYLDDQLAPFLPKKSLPTILYAPTWNDNENNSSFDQVSKMLIEMLPDDLNLIIKLHPNIFASPELLEVYRDIHSKKENLSILPEFPSVYPILDHVDFYLGDMSSIGYDFLTFRKPMFFLNTNQRDPQNDLSLYLTQCGRVIEPEDFGAIYSIIKEDDSSMYTKKQEILYHSVFGKEEKIKEGLNTYYEQFIHSC